MADPQDQPSPTILAFLLSELVWPPSLLQLQRADKAQNAASVRRQKPAYSSWALTSRTRANVSQRHNVLQCYAYF
jgi:hypothetical protein